ncbi:hypothetical protein J4E80_009874 [Alternaria sp. BMP 0032]|nr:hypothetical protein J4E80_009874 [Alternaria sp. BMP 0032]
MSHYQSRRERLEIDVMNRILREPDYQPFLREEVNAANKFRATRAYQTHREAYDKKNSTPAASTSKPDETTPAQHEAGDGKSPLASKTPPAASTSKPDETTPAQHEVGDGKNPLASQIPPASTPKPSETTPAQHEAGDGKKPLAPKTPPPSTPKPNKTPRTEHTAGDEQEPLAEFVTRKSPITTTATFTTAAPIPTAAPISTAANIATRVPTATVVPASAASPITALAPITALTITPSVQRQTKCSSPPSINNDEECSTAIPATIAAPTTTPGVQMQHNRSPPMNINTPEGYSTAIPFGQSSAQPPQPESRKKVKLTVDLSQPPSQSDINAMQITMAKVLDIASDYILKLTLRMETCPRAGMLRDVVHMAMQQYQESDGAIPLTLLPLGPWPISLASMLEVSQAKMWLSGTTIDFLVERCGSSRGYLPEVVYVATSSPVYMETIGKSSSNPEIRPDITSLIPQSVFILPELDAAASIVFTWNPTNSHWVVVHALCMDFGAGLMRVYDTGRRYQSTTMFEQELRQFLALVALSHPRSRLANVDWNTVAIRYEDIIQQKADDCGVFAAWNVRTLLHNDQPAKSASNALRVGMALRQELFTEAHSTISGRDPPYCSSQAALDAHIEHLSGNHHNDDESKNSDHHDHNDDKSKNSDHHDHNDDKSKHPYLNDYNDYLSRDPDDNDYDSDSSDGYAERIFLSQTHVDPSWQDEHDLLLKSFSGLLTKPEALKALLAGRKNGVPGPRLARRLKRRTFARGVTRWARLSKIASRSIKHVKNDGSVVSGMYRKGCARLLLASPELYALEDHTTIRATATRAIFGTDLHVCASAPDPTRTYDLVLPCFRRSARPRDSPRSDTEVLQNESEDVDVRLQAMYDQWEQVFNNHPRPHDKMDTQGALAMQGFGPVWIPLVLGFITSTLPVLSSAGHSARVASVYDTMRRVINHVQALAGRRIRVLFLFPGVDGLTTNNGSWQYLVDRFPEVLFSLTAIVSPQLGVLYPSVFTKIGRYTWTHIDVEELYSRHSEMLRGSGGYININQRKVVDVPLM